jgi:diguanylate cyclase (GGDEF)-like protein/PAS domain S-box-containing protein
MPERPARTPFRPFERRGRRVIPAILLTFALSATVSVGLSIWATSRSRHRAAVFQVAARQQTLAARYVGEVLLVRSGARADPYATARILSESAHALLDGGEAPAVDGYDDEAEVGATTEPVARRQLVQEARLVTDLTAAGRAILAGHSAASTPLTAGETIAASDPVSRLRVLSALTANVSRDAETTITAADDANIDHLIDLQVLLGALGLVVSLLLALGLIRATRRQTAHFRSLVTSSTDLVLVLGPRGCIYVGQAVTQMLGCAPDAILGEGLEQFVHPEDWAATRSAQVNGGPPELPLRVRDRFGAWRHLEAHVSDLRDDRVVRGVVLNARDVTERLRLEEQLTRKAFHDDLTGLPNRALLRDRVDQALARSRGPLALLLIDLDGFKQVNDTLGHDAGDELLRQVTARFAAIAGPRDTLARLGGDEFVLLLERAGEAQAISAAERLLAAARVPQRIDDRDFTLSASIGIVTRSDVSGDSTALLRHADVAMYAAKAAGRARHEIFRDAMAQEVGEQLGLEHELRIAIDQGELTLHYQPEVALDGAALTGVEALLRWESPTRGMVPPAHFIPVAESSGLILPIGELVLREACAQTARWRSAGLLPAGFVTWVNVSVKQLMAGGLTALVEDALASTGLPPSSLGLEITETAIVEQGPGAQRLGRELEDLHARGVRIAIDDFGTGFSSLGQLRHFPIDMLKIDRSFVAGIEHDAKDAAIAANLVSLAHALGSLAIAEGVETPGQLAYLRGLGCDLAQGFLFSRPLPAAALGEWLAEPVARAQAA